VPGADNRYLALCVLMASEQKVNIMAEETGSRFLTVNETETSAFIEGENQEWKIERRRQHVVQKRQDEDK
jgi:hypothetical protein